MDNDYHFRRYFPAKNHPCLIVLVRQSEDKNGNIVLSGFTMTHSIKPVIARPNKYFKIKNPNPNDDAECYLYVDPIKNKSIHMFSSPIEGWKLSKTDTVLIEKLIVSVKDFQTRTIERFELSS